MLYGQQHLKRLKCSKSWECHHSPARGSDSAAEPYPGPKSPQGGCRGDPHGGEVCPCGTQAQGGGNCRPALSKLDVFLSKLSAGCHCLLKYSEEMRAPRGRSEGLDPAL